MECSYILFRQPLYRILRGSTFSCQFFLTVCETNAYNLSNTSSGPRSFTFLNFTLGNFKANWDQLQTTFCLSCLFFIHLVFLSYVRWLPNTIHLVFLLLLSRLLVNCQTLRQCHRVLLASCLNRHGLSRTHGTKRCFEGFMRFLQVLTFRTLIQLLILFISYHFHLF